MPRPLYVYDNWSAYDELSDNVALTEELAMRQFAEVQRLRTAGVTIDCYLMDAFWYTPDGGYREWRPDRWPNGPDKWLAACADSGLLPGLWFPANTAFQLVSPREWADSLAANDYGFCCFLGGFMAGFVGVLDYWYGRGVRVFKFDFAEFGARPKGSELTPGEARPKNLAAYREALAGFKTSHPEAVLLAYNGFEEGEFMPTTDQQVRHVFDPAWLELFDTVYCGDPRPADLPLPNFWRTTDVYADAMIYLLHRGSGLDLGQIDNCAFMIGQCGTCYRRGSASWRTTALLSYARAGRVHMVLGNLEALNDEDVAWMARVQKLYESAGATEWVGGNPGQGELYAYKAGELITAVNPSLLPRRLVVGDGFNLLYSDGLVVFAGSTLTLGAGAAAVLGNSGESLGAGDLEPLTLTPLSVDWSISGLVCEGDVPVPAGFDLHLVFQQQGADGRALRTSGGSPPDGTSSVDLLRISVTQAGKALVVQRPDDKVIWSGMSWAYGVVDARELSEEPIHVVFESTDPLVSAIFASAYLATNSA